jgi:hypothetical protein
MSNVCEMTEGDCMLWYAELKFLCLIWDKLYFIIEYIEILYILTVCPWPKQDLIYYLFLLCPEKGSAATSWTRRGLSESS